MLIKMHLCYGNLKLNQPSDCLNLQDPCENQPQCLDDQKLTPSSILQLISIFLIQIHFLSQESMFQATTQPTTTIEQIQLYLDLTSS